MKTRGSKENLKNQIEINKGKIKIEKKEWMNKSISWKFQLIQKKVCSVAKERIMLVFFYKLDRDNENNPTNSKI